MNRSREEMLALAERFDGFRRYWFGRWILGPFSGLLALAAITLRTLARENDRHE